LSDLIDPPHVYRYNPARYHGPTLYYFAWLSTLAVGVTAFALRFVTAIFGIGTIILILNARSLVGKTTALSAAALIAFSPAAVYYSRYFIHEALLGFFTVATFISVMSYLQTRRPSQLLLASTAAALMFATKETALIAAVVLSVSHVGALMYLRWRQTNRTDGAPSSISSDMRRPPVDQVQNLRTQSPQAMWWPRPWLAVMACAIFVGLNVVFYSSFFTHPEGILAALLSFAPWGSTGLQRHTHPLSTYLTWLLQEESPVLLLGAAGAALAFWRPNNAVAVVAALWALGSIVAYSLIPYKTPWLILNMVLPLALVGGHAVEAMRESRYLLVRRMAVVAMTAALLVSGYQAVILSFVRYDDHRYPYVYVHTNREILELVRQVDKVMQQDGIEKRPTMAVTSPVHFPLNWYFRGYSVGYYGGSTAVNDPMIIGSLEQDDTLRAKLGSSFQRFGPYLLRPGVRLVLYVRRDLLVSP
jgi:uncharacterized protein (TIGR03663 family)